MRTAIEFDRQFRRIAVKIYDVPANHLLPSKVEPVDRVSAQSLPEPALGCRHFLAQSFGKGEFLRLDALKARDLADSLHRCEEPNP